MKRIAFMRVWNEEKTIIPCLMSLEGVFTHFVIVHSDITDSTLERLERYTKGRTNFFIERYRYHVFPAHHPAYQENLRYENTLAAYYTFCWNLCRKIGGTIAKIDADQVYLTEAIKTQLDHFDSDSNDLRRSFTWGFNSLVSNNRLYLWKNRMTNGGHDHFIISDKIALVFNQTQHYETISYRSKDMRIIEKFSYPQWFHFMKRIVGVGIPSQSLDEISEHELSILTEKQRDLFESNIRPLLIESNSEYANIEI